MGKEEGAACSMLPHAGFTHLPPALDRLSSSRLGAHGGRRDRVGWENRTGEEGGMQDLGERQGQRGAKEMLGKDSAVTRLEQ